MSPNEIGTNYIAAWNERDPAKRRAAVAKAWASNGTYVDPHRKATGRDEIDTMLGPGAGDRWFEYGHCGLRRCDTGDVNPDLTAKEDCDRPA